MNSATHLPWSVYKYVLEAEDLAEKVGDVVETIVGRRPIGDDAYLHRLRKAHAPDVFGLVALKVVWGGREATVITAPGRFFKDPDLRIQLDKLRRVACETGRFTLLIERRTFLKRLHRQPEAAGAGYSTPPSASPFAAHGGVLASFVTDRSGGMRI